ncbi:MAG: TonB-linked SusC/RagA family outer membrane protein [Limisphaerales bacterium]|jgi:TonB-linked SusC/RagA family outer membrane protein
MMQNLRMGFIVMLLCLTAGLQAQINISGTVKDEGGESLPGVSISVKGTAIGTSTDLDGKYSLEIPGSDATVVYSYIGYESREESVSGSAIVNMAMAESISKLDEVVVTGLASSVSRSNLANSIGTVSSRELTEITNVATMDAALYGKFKGANITQNSGAPGGGISIKLRGITSLTASSQPLYIVDGVYIDNSAVAAELNSVSGAAGQGSASNQDNPSNRIADLDPEDIEKIEILKGASASAIYGSRAGAGVVLITTKQGKSGKPVIRLSQTIGANWQLNKLGVRDWDAAKVEQFWGIDEVANFNAAEASGGLTNFEDELYGNTGISSTTRLSASGGSDKTQVFAGFTYKNDEGIVANTGYEKYSARLNIKHKLFDFMDLTATSNFINSSADRAFFNNDNTGTTMGVSFVATPPWADLAEDENGIYPDNPYAGSNFLQTRDQITNNEQVNRIITGATITTRLFSNEKHNLKLIGRGGVDYYNLETTALFPRTLQFQKDGNGTDGASIIGNTNNVNSNFSGILVYSVYPSSKLSFRTQLGLTTLNFNQNSIVNTATFLIGTQANLDQAGSITARHNRIIQQDKGFFAQEEINYEDKILFTVGLRGDKSSNNGDPNELFFYPKASAAFNLHNMLDFNEDNINLLKLRVAYGQAGQFAVFGATYTPLEPAVIQGTTGSLIGLTKGNSDIGPEQQTEIEAGIDLGLFRNKVNIDITVYQKSITDLLLNVNVPTSSGFTREWQNVADLTNQGLEIGLSTTPFRSDNFNWNTRFSFWMNRSEVDRLDVPAFTTGAFGATLGSYYFQQGSSATQLVGIGDEADDEDGDGLIVYGDAEPDFQLSWFNTMKIMKNVDVSFLLHWKQGGSNVNLSTLLSDLSGTSGDYDETGLDPDGLLSNGDYRLSQLGVSANVFVEDASYLRLREIGVYYTLPLVTDDVRIKIGVSGRNLLNFFDYNSYDPEVSNFGANAISSAVEVTPFPSAKSAFFHVSATF